MRVALRGDDLGLAGAVTAAGGEVVDGDGGTGTDADADAIVAVGTAAVADAARADGDVPVLPVGADGPHTVARPEATEAVRRLVAGEGRRVAHPVVTVRVGGEPVAEAAYEAALVTTEPARISEYAVDGDGERVDVVRADGVVVATPLGSAGYARAAGGPLLAAGTGLAVVPVSPFTTSPDTWVVAREATLTVARDEGDVSLVVDGEATRAVDPDEPVRVAVDREATLYRLPTTA